MTKYALSLFKCSFSVSYLEFMYGASDYAIYGTKWSGIFKIIDELKNKISTFNNKLRSTPLNTDLKSGSYSQNCLPTTTFETDLNTLFSNSASPLSVVSPTQRKTLYSLIPSDASKTPGEKIIEFDHSDYYINTIKNEILSEYIIVSKSLPIILQAFTNLIAGNHLEKALNKIEKFRPDRQRMEDAKSVFLNNISKVDNTVVAVSIIIICYFAFHLILILLIILTIILYIF